jgi:hypothetical protein
MDEHLTLLQRVKAQAEVLVPLIKRMERELGRDQAHQLVRETLSDHYRSVARQYVRESNGDRMAAFMQFGQVSAEGGAIDMQPKDSPPGRANVDIVRCSYAKFFQELGEPDLGFLLVCAADFPMAEELGVGLERTQTIMQGADHCDFSWILEPSTASAPHSTLRRRAGAIAPRVIHTIASQPGVEHLVIPTTCAPLGTPDDALLGEARFFQRSLFSRVSDIGVCLDAVRASMREQVVDEHLLCLSADSLPAPGGGDEDAELPAPRFRRSPRVPPPCHSSGPLAVRLDD